MRLAAGLAVVAAFLAGAPEASGQGVAGSAKTARALLPDGQPDIQGTWGGNAGGCSIETGICPEFFTGRPGRPERTEPRSVVTDPKEGKIPYRPEMQARRLEIAKHINNPQNLRGIDSRVLCFASPPRSSYNYAFNIIQTRDYLIMAWEWSHLYRVISLRGGPHPNPAVKLLMGNSRGKWEGNTLVVETANLNDWSWFDDGGSFHSDRMTLVERFTVVDGTRIDYKATITDPEVFTRPWTMELPITRRASLSLPMAPMEDVRFNVPADDPHATEPWEHACVEGERSVETMLHKPAK